MSHCRVLAVDDDPLVLQMYRRIFSATAGSSGSALDQLMARLEESESIDSPLHAPRFQTLLCTQGEEAVAALELSQREGVPFQLALIDMRMPPGIDGLETARRIRQVDHEVAIAFVSAYTTRSKEEVASELRGAVTWFDKPFSSRVLLEEAVYCCQHGHWRSQRPNSRNEGSSDEASD